MSSISPGILKDYTTKKYLHPKDGGIFKSNQTMN